MLIYMIDHISYKDTVQYIYQNVYHHYVNCDIPDTMKEKKLRKKNPSHLHVKLPLSLIPGLSLTIYNKALVSRVNQTRASGS